MKDAGANHLIVSRCSLSGETLYVLGSFVVQDERGDVSLSSMHRYSIVMISSARLLSMSSLNSGDIESTLQGEG